LESENIRLENIDAPELKSKCDVERRLALVAKRELERIISVGTPEMHAPRGRISTAARSRAYQSTAATLGIR